LAGLSEARSEQLALYGRKLGMAFQIMDDLLDYTGDEALIGKSLGDDLAEGKPTLPLIRAQQQLPAAEKQRLRDIIEAGEREAIGEVIALLQATDALTYSRAAAGRLAEEAMQALAGFPDSAYKDALFSLAQRTTARER